MEKIGHSYQIVCTGSEEFYIDLRPGRGCAAIGRLSEGEIDVIIEIGPSDLVSLLSGQMSPLDAYLTGRINVTGDTNVAMKLSLLSEHVQGYQ